MRISGKLLALFLLFVSSNAFAQGIGPGGSGGAPTGAAGGDLSGTYPNPTVAKVAGVTPGTGVATALGVATNTSGGMILNGATAAGDLSGTLPNPTVAKVNGNTPGGSCGANTFASSVDSSGRPTCTQPAVTGLSGYTATTWTPTITASTTAGTPTYTAQVGTYEQIGRNITVRFLVSISSWSGSPAGNVQIGGLPITSANTANNYGSCTLVNYSLSGTGLPANNNGINAFIAPNTAVGTLQTNGLTASTSLTPAQIGTASTVQFIGMCNYNS